MVVERPKSIGEKVTAWLSLRDLVMIGGLVVAGGAWALRMDTQVAAIRQDVSPLIEMTDNLHQRVQRLEDTGFRGSEADKDLRAIELKIANIELAQTRMLVTLEQISSAINSEDG